MAEIFTVVASLMTVTIIIIIVTARKVWLGTPANQIRHPKCAVCNGGIQALLPREDGKPRWGKIPPHLLSFVRDGGDDIWRPPLASTRRCRCCAGLGRHPTHRKNAKCPSKVI